MKGWKQVFLSYRYIGIVSILIIAVAFTASALISMSYEKTIVKYLNGYLKEHLTTRLSMDENIRFRFLKGFPNTTIEIKNVLLESGTDFSRQDFTAICPSDTLMYASSVYLRFNPFKMLRKDYEVKKIEISGGILNILFDHKNQHNLKIWKSGEGDQNKYNIKLRNIILTNTRFRILTLDNKISFDGGSVRTVFKGGLSSGILSGETKGHLRIKRLAYRDKELVVRSNLQLAVNLIYSTRHFRISGGTIQLNRASADISGEYIANKNNVIDLRLNMHQFGLAELMSVLPLKPQAGNYSFTGGGKMNLDIKGPLSVPSKLLISSQFELNDCQARNTVTRTTLSGIDLKGSVAGTRQENFHLVVDTFNANLGKGVLGGRIEITNLNQLSFRSDLHASVDLKDLSQFIGIGDSIHMAGIMNTSFRASGSLRQFSGKPLLNIASSVQYGTFSFEKAALSIQGIPYSAHNISGRANWNNDIRLDSISLKMNDSEVLLNGAIHNLKPWIASGGILKPDLTITCDIVDITKHLKKDRVAGTKDRNSSFFPADVYIKAVLDLKKFVAGKFEATDLSASLVVFEDSMLIDRASFSFPDGSISGKAVLKAEADGSYSLTCNAHPEKININQLFTVFNNFTQSFIVDKNLRGQLGGSVDFYARWDTSFKIIPSSVKAVGNITISNGELVQFEPMLKLSRYIDVDELKHIRFKTLRNSIYISDRLVSIPEMNINSTAFNISVSGQHDFDNLFDYRLRVLLSEVLFNKARKRKHELNEFLVEESPADQTTIPLIIAGTPKDFDVKFDRKKAFSLSRNKNIIDEKPKPDNFRVEWEEPTQSTTTGSSEMPESGVVIEWDE